MAVNALEQKENIDKERKVFPSILLVLHYYNLKGNNGGQPSSFSL